MEDGIVKTVKNSVIPEELLIGTEATLELATNWQHKRSGTAASGSGRSDYLVIVIWQSYS